MKPQALEAVYHLRNHDSESIRMQLSAEDFAHIAGVLTNLYSDRLMAVIREYMTNAWDSHVEAGNADPIQVKLPTAGSPLFEVRDWGVGLSVDDLRDIYSLYGKSTKRDSDAVNGVLGLGCKAALCYAVSFNVHAVKNGVKTIATISKDTDGVGEIQIMDTVATEEPNGVTIQVPVKLNDISLFADKVLSFVQYWPSGTVLVNAGAHSGEDVTGLRGEPLWLDPDVAVFPGAYGTDDSRIVMGNVAYPFNTSNLKESGQLYGLRVVVWVPMGGVHFTPSRESLQMTRHTQETIATIEDFVRERFALLLTERLETVSTNYERAKLFIQWQGNLPPSAKRMLRMIGGAGTGNMHVSFGRHNKGWSWSADRNWRRGTYAASGSASKIDSLSWSSIADEKRAIVTQFPYANLSPTHRDRLREFGLTEVSILPRGVNTMLLEGRPALYTWDEILANTAGPAKAERGKQEKTKYTVRHQGVYHETSQIIPKRSDVIIYTSISDGVDHICRIFPDAYVVALRSRQVDRFKRLHPTATLYADYLREETERLKKALTDEESVALVLSQHQGTFLLEWAWLSVLPRLEGLVEDPDLKQLIAARSLSTKRLDAARRIGVRMPQHEIFRTIPARYPLLTAVSNDRLKIGATEDLALYLNAKYAETSQ